MKHSLVIPFFCIICFTACEPGLILDENLKIENAQWEREKTANFEFEIEDSTGVYEIYLNFRHGGEYPYQNLYLFTETFGPLGLTAKDTAQMLLADNRGRWLGKGIGDIFDYQFKYKEGQLFPAKGSYRFKIEQAMYDKVLDNVTNVGLTIKKINK